MYALLFNDGITPSNGVPEPPETAGGTAPVVHSLVAATERFREWLRESGNDYTRADGYDQPWCDVYNSDAWDGISYGDPWWRFERTKSGGISKRLF